MVELLMEIKPKLRGNVDQIVDLNHAVGEFAAIFNMGVDVPNCKFNEQEFNSLYFLLDLGSDEHIEKAEIHIDNARYLYHKKLKN